MGTPSKSDAGFRDQGRDPFESIKAKWIRESIALRAKTCSLCHEIHSWHLNWGFADISVSPLVLSDNLGRANISGLVAGISMFAC
jgi:hypothetical protein